MKKLILIIGIVLIGFTAQAQDNDLYQRRNGWDLFLYHSKGI